MLIKYDNTEFEFTDGTDFNRVQAWIHTPSGDGNNAFICRQRVFANRDPDSDFQRYLRHVILEGDDFHDDEVASIHLKFHSWNSRYPNLCSEVIHEIIRRDWDPNDAAKWASNMNMELNVDFDYFQTKLFNMLGGEFNMKLRDLENHYLQVRNICWFPLTVDPDPLPC